MSLVESYNEANIFLGLIEYELYSLLGASHLVDYISVHIRFDLERYLLNIQLKVVSNQQLRLDMHGIFSISQEISQAFQKLAVEHLTERTVA